MGYGTDDEPRMHRGGKSYTLKEALNKTYLVKCGATGGVIPYVPKVLIGRRVKLRIINNGGEK